MAPVLLFISHLHLEANYYFPDLWSSPQTQLLSGTSMSSLDAVGVPSLAGPAISLQAPGVPSASSYRIFF